MKRFCSVSLFIVSLVIGVFLITSCDKKTTESEDTEAPTVIITYPANNSEIISGTLVTIQTDVSDNEEIEKVEFYIDDSLVETDYNSPYNYEWDTTDLTVSHTIYAKAFDTSDNSATSDVITVTITEAIGNPPNPPTNPLPSDNATSVSIYTNLSWDCTDPDGDTLTYDVYFGTSSDPPLVNSGQSNTTYDPGTLNNEVTYYWKIKAHDDHSNSTTGDIWEFETRGEMIFVQGGTFEMGDHYNEGGSDELPVHSVTLDDFYIGKYEVTQTEYEAVVGNNPSYFSGDDLPVEQVTWCDAVTFCNLKSQQEGLTPCYNLNDWSCDFSANGYRLPTEAEWEYAARGGINWTDDYRYSGCHEYSDLPDYAWYYSNSGYHTHEVGTRLPNQLDIYDMSGNVWEWCNDWYHRNYYFSSPSNNPQGPASGYFRINRCGSCLFPAGNCKVADRDYFFPDAGWDDLGFRFVRTP